jgi:hypothetical protein
MISGGQRRLQLTDLGMPAYLQGYDLTPELAWQTPHLGRPNQGNSHILVQVCRPLDGFSLAPAEASRLLPGSRMAILKLSEVHHFLRARLPPLLHCLDEVLSGLVSKRGICLDAGAGVARPLQLLTGSIDV